MCNFVAGLALTTHIFTQAHYNDVHPYLFCEDYGVRAGAMVNSETSLSIFAAYEFTMFEPLAVELGFASGYDLMRRDNGSPYIPMVRISWKFKNGTEAFALPVVEYDEFNQQKWGVALGYAVPLSRYQF